MHLSEHNRCDTVAKPRFHKAGAPINEIEITPEMIKAGEEAFADCDPRFMRPSSMAVLIFEAMAKKLPPEKFRHLCRHNNQSD